MFDDLFLTLPTITFFEICLNIGIAFIFGLIISLIYRYTYNGYSYSPSFVNMLIIIAMVTSIVMMVIGNNLARAFGLVGAMSIIRFRTVVKDTKDIAFVFFALAAGMAAGAGNHLIAVTGCTFVALIILMLYQTGYGITSEQEMLLKFYMLHEDDNESIYLPIFKKYLKFHKLLNVKSVRLGQFLELSFHIRFKNPTEHQNFVQELSAQEGIERISLLFGEEWEK